MRARITAAFPQAEIVAMLGAPLTDDQMAALEERTRLSPSNRPGLRPATGLDACGPLRTGDPSHGWKLVGIHPEPPSLYLTVASENGLQAQLELRPDDGGGHHVPFPVAEGGLYYRTVSFPFSRLEPACKEIAARVRSALAGRSLRETLDSWIGRASGPTSPHAG